MNFKKLTAALTALAACASLCIPAVAFAEDDVAAVTATADAPSALTAYLDFVDGGWKSKYEKGDEDTLIGKDAEITGDGTYTVSVSVDKEKMEEDSSTSGVQFMAVMIPDAETVYPNIVITVDSIKADDKEIAMSAKNYTSSDDGKVTRTNIYNAYVGKDKETGAYIIPDDARSTEGKLSEIGTTDYSPVVINPDDLSGWETLSVEFTISGMESQEETSESETETESESESVSESETETESASEAESESETEAETANQGKTVVGNSYLNFVDGGWWPKYQGADDDSLAQTPVEVTGNGSYTVSVTAADLDDTAIQEGISGVEFMAIIIPDAYEKYSDMVITIDSIVADGKEIPMIAKNYTSSDDEKEVRTNIYNPWVSKLPNDAHSTEGKLSELEDSSAYSYKVINPEDFAAWKTLSVNFTVSGLAFDKYVEEEAPSTTDSGSNSGNTTNTGSGSQNGNKGVASTTASKTKSVATTTTTAKAAASSSTSSSGSTDAPKTGDMNFPIAAAAVATVAAGAFLITKKKND